MAQKAQNIPAKQEALFTQIAQKYLDIETLEEQSRDALDFHECVVWAIKDALKAAYDAGVQSTSKGNNHNAA